MSSRVARSSTGGPVESVAASGGVSPSGLPVVHIAPVGAALVSPVEAPPEAASQSRFSWWTVIAGSFIALSTLLMLTARQSPAVQTLGITFVGIVLEALPFVMLGSLLSGIVEVFISRERLASVLPRRPVLAILCAGCLGLVLPVCECAIIPVTRRLLRKGVPLAAAVAYLLAGPVVNPLVGASTLVAYGGSWQVVALRLGIAYVVAVTVALIMTRLFPGSTAMQDGGLDHAKGHACSDGCGHDHVHEHEHGHEHEHSHACGHEHHEHAPAPLQKAAGCCGGSCAGDKPVAAAQRPPLGRRLLDVLHHAAEDFLYVGQFLIVGAWLAAACQLERATVAQLAESPYVGIPVMMLLAIMLNLCSEADAFVAVSFRGMTSLPAQMGFMVLGPMLDLKLSAMYLTFLRKRAFFTLAALIFVTVFAAMIVLSLVLQGMGS